MCQLGEEWGGALIVGLFWGWERGREEGGGFRRAKWSYCGLMLGTGVCLGRRELFCDLSTIMLFCLFAVGKKVVMVGFRNGYVIVGCSAPLGLGTKGAGMETAWSW